MSRSAMRMLRCGARALSAAAALATLAAPMAAAAPGDLDETFSEDGRVRVDVASGWESGLALAPAPGGGVTALAANTSDGSLVLARLDSGGAPLSAGQGVRAIPLDGFWVNDAAVLSGGGFLLAGSDGSQPAVVKLTAAGTLDSTFSGDGEHPLPVSAWSIAAQPDGTFVTARPIPTGTPAPGEVGISRYLPTGGFDPTFNGGGEARLELPGIASIVGSVAVDKDGRIAVGATSGSEYSPDPAAVQELAVAVVGANGQPDAGFSGNGVAHFDIDPATEEPADVEFDDAGRVVAAVNGCNRASTHPRCTRAYLARISVAGDLDGSFSGDGVVPLGPGESQGVNDLALDPEGRPVAVGDVGFGGCRLCESEVMDFRVWRATNGGAPDPAFSQDGHVSTDFGQAEAERAQATMIDDAGRIVALGGVGDGLGVARYEVAPGPADADADGKLDADDRCPQLWAKHPSGCPKHGASVHLYRLTRDDALRARLRAAAGCGVENRKVRLLRVKPGRDRRVARARSGGRGFATFTGIDRAGRYRAKLPGFVEPDFGLCGPARSKSVRLRLSGG